MSKLQAMPKSYTRALESQTSPTITTAILKNPLVWYITLATALTFYGAVSNAKTYHKSPPANPISEYEAKALAFNNPKTIVWKCDAQMITEKGTFKNIPATGSNNFVQPPTEEQKAIVKGAK